MKNNVFKVVLLQALPASGKSEVRNFMAHVEPGRLQEEFHIGENLQLDDFPYVHMMRRIDNELQAMGQERVFYPGEEPFKDGRDWGTLCNLLNEDYHDLMNRNVIKTDSAAKLLFDRLDRAGLAAGIKPRMGLLKEEIRDKLASILEKEARIMLNEKHAGYPESFENKTIHNRMRPGRPGRRFHAPYRNLRLSVFPAHVLSRDTGKCRDTLYLGHARGVPPQERGQGGSKRSRFQPASRSANGGNAGRLWL